MGKIIIHNEKAQAFSAADVIKTCPFGAIEAADGVFSINSNCKMCRLCCKQFSSLFEFQETALPQIDKSQW